MAGASGWLLIPIGGMPELPDSDRLEELANGGTFDFENGDVYSDVSQHRQFVYVDSDEAPTLPQALELMLDPARW